MKQVRDVLQLHSIGKGTYVGSILLASIMLFLNVIALGLLLVKDKSDLKTTSLNKTSLVVG